MVRKCVFRVVFGKLFVSSAGDEFSILCANNSRPDAFAIIVHFLSLVIGIGDKKVRTDDGKHDGFDNPKYNLLHPSLSCFKLGNCLLLLYFLLLAAAIILDHLITEIPV